MLMIIFLIIIDSFSYQKVSKLSVKELRTLPKRAYGLVILPSFSQVGVAVSFYKKDLDYLVPRILQSIAMNTRSN